MTNSKNVDYKLIHLKDGRYLAFSEYGNSDGKPLIYFHGFPGSRLEGAILEQASSQLEARIISVDRPGMGLSSFKKNRTVLDIVDDIEELADTLDFQRFGMIGLSGGGPYVAACAYKIPDRITSASIISGLGPMNINEITSNMLIMIRVAFWLSRNAPSFSRVSYYLLKYYLKQTQDLSFLKNLPEPDNLVINVPEVKSIFSSSMIEAFHSGIRGVAWESRLLARAWDFNLEDVKYPIKLWHGVQDRNVPYNMGKYVAAHLTKCQATYFNNEGHFSLAVNHAAEIIAASL